MSGCLSNTAIAQTLSNLIYLIFCLFALIIYLTLRNLEFFAHNFSFIYNHWRVSNKNCTTQALLTKWQTDMKTERVDSLIDE